MKKTIVKVVQDEQKPVETAVLARAIVDIAGAAKRLTLSGLNRKAVVLLIAHDSGCSQNAVKAVLDSMANLQATYLTR